MATGRSCNKEPSTTETSKVPTFGFTGSNNKNNLYYFFVHPFFVGLQMRMILQQDRNVSWHWVSTRNTSGFCSNLPKNYLGINYFVLRTPLSSGIPVLLLNQSVVALVMSDCWSVHQNVWVCQVWKVRNNLDWKRSSGWLVSCEGLLLVTDVSTTCAEAIFRVKW